jgi:hypothetical protein
MKTVDRVFGALLLLGSFLHAYGSITAYRLGTPELVWALAGGLAALLTALLNLLRSGRPEDHSLAWIAFAASVGWFAVATGFGAAIGNLSDPRVLWHLVCGLALAAFSVRTALGYASSRLTPLRSPPH